MIAMMVGSFISCFGFCFLFNLDIKKIIPTCINCVVGTIFYQLVLNYNGNEYFALVLCSFVISFGSELLARYLKAPALVFLVCPLIPFVPGGGAYYTILNLFQNNIPLAISYGVSTILKAGSIVIGVALAGNVFKLFFSKKH